MSNEINWMHLKIHKEKTDRKVALYTEKGGKYHEFVAMKNERV